MESREWSYTDKSDWGAGPWNEEPDKAQWEDEETGLPCLIVRGPVGALCGYVGVSRDHPLFGHHYDSAHANADVHGGLTFSNTCTEGEPEHGICHIVEEGEDDLVWWFGFDCAHFGDLSPGMMFSRSIRRGDEVYRRWGYVKDEVRDLAKQLAQVVA